MTDLSLPIPAHLMPQQGELVLFPNQPLLERLSRIQPGVVLAVFVPALLASVYLSLTHGTGVGGTVSLFLAGAFFWTFFEYALHRSVFHFYPRGEFQTRLQFIMHGVHHQYPQDKDRLVMPITVSVPLALILLALFRWILGDWVWGFFSGFLAGYITYDMMHYAIHHSKIFQSAPLRGIRNHHLAHHFRDTRRGFGVSSRLWDVIFRT